MIQQSKRHGKNLGIALFALLVWAIAGLWSWNTFAVELLGLSEMAYRHALASAFSSFRRVGCWRCPVGFPVRRRVVSLKSKIVAQFGQPSGPLGALAGRIMAARTSNRFRNEKTVELMNLHPDSRVLEIGCGPAWPCQDVPLL